MLAPIYFDGVDLESLVLDELRLHAAPPGQLSIKGSEVRLAPNAVKYGALSQPSGTLDVSCNAHDDNDLVVMWTERGGPPVVAPASALGGFGSRLMHRSMSAQLGGDIAFDWSVEGVVVALRISKARLAM